MTFTSSNKTVHPMTLDAAAGYARDLVEMEGEMTKQIDVYIAPCPMCGCGARLEKDKNTGTWAVTCDNIGCGLCTSGWGVPETATLAWNRRTIPSIPVMGVIGDPRPAPDADPLGR